MRTRLILAAAILGVAAVSLWLFLTRPRLPAAERGRRIAERMGCFACHGPGGIRGAANPGRAEASVPTFEGDLMMYAQDRAEIREWIRDGVPEARARSRRWQKERERGLLVMPAFGARLSDRGIEDLAAFVEATSGRPAPDDSLARRGLARARELGCFGCHGRGGRFAPPNPGSFKGYVPSWDGEDFAELVRGRAEFGEWVEDGVSRRFRANPLARFFLDRAVLKMPSYRDRLEAGDTDALWAYVRWLRAEGASGAISH